MSGGATRKLTKAEQRSVDSKTRLTSPAASLIAIVIAVLWTVPTAGLLITSFRPENDVRRTGWWTVFLNPTFTPDTYLDTIETDGLVNSFINSFIITIPGVIIPILLALLAAYAFAWIDFKGRNILFAGVFALQVVPIQVTLIPLLTQYVNWGLAGTYWTVWLSHAIFGLPLAIFLMHNFMKEIPASLIEAARVDGAGHVRVFFQVLLPLLVPAIASFGIFQFLWVWNDLLVALTFAGAEYSPITKFVASLQGSFGGSWHLLSAGAFISMIVPLVVFISLQRFFVRGLLAGGVKG
ncbi:MAG TPA: carbohydrate ABC transporter permease [Propionibacteriaceae bacterium]|nr:carbohydrate ABC transporter permease [Propionibacteriaceae bacterium]HPZ48367.1 carbohydrate ABC transporter permease [Propionibacteriaceae bacterium]HQE30997.1 carbohydrate ABC transporter permease [Propionibacteriaceae bacterium]